MLREFLRMVIPSMLAFALSGVYGIVDGFFIGQNIGDGGLGAINIAFPLTAFMQSIGSGVGMGGAILYSVSRGEGNREKTRAYYHSTLQLLLVVGVFSMIALKIFSPILLPILGAEGELYRLAQEYIDYIVFGSAFQVMATGLVPMIRNLGGSMIAMIAMICGFVCNIVLDIVLVPPYGMAGAAVATIASQGLTAVISLVYLWRKEGLFHYVPMESLLKQCGEIAKEGISPMGLSYSPNIILMLMNKFAMIYGGASGVATYAVLSYVTWIAQLLLQGIGDGAQPLFSYAYGSNDLLKLRQLKRYSVGCTVGVGILCVGIVLGVQSLIGPFFGASATVCQLILEAIPYFAVSYFFGGLLRNKISMFNATRSMKAAYLLIIGEPVGLFALLLVLPIFYGIEGLWISFLMTQVLLSVFAWVLSGRGQK